MLFDGDPCWPELGSLWEAFATTQATCAGVAATYLVACMKAGLEPAEAGLERLKALGPTGSPLPAAAARWAYSHVKDDIMLGSFSGGTDVCKGFVGPSSLHPVWAGEIPCRCLGAKVDVFNDAGKPVVGEEGELVLTGPMPSMPVCLWGDDGSRYRAAYLERFPGTWAHGDRALLTERHSVVISGRSDGTLKRAGVRIGTAELYSVVEELPEVSDSLAVHLEDPDGGPGEIWLFVVPAEAPSGSYGSGEGAPRAAFLNAPAPQCASSLPVTCPTGWSLRRGVPLRQGRPLLDSTEVDGLLCAFDGLLMGRATEVHAAAAGIRVSAKTSLQPSPTSERR